MIKNVETEIFEKIIYLPRAKHYFKFIVDNKWVCSNQYPTTMDNSNNQNNFIDLTNYTPPNATTAKSGLCTIRDALEVSSNIQLGAKSKYKSQKEKYTYSIK